jgi:hypothetical protein
MRYEVTYQRLLGLACVIGPLLNLTASVLYTAGNLALEAVVGLYAMTLFIPAYQGVALLIGRRLPAFGIVVAILGFLNTVGVAAYAARAFGYMLVQAGLLQTQAAVFDLPVHMPVFMAYGLLGLLSPLLPIVSAVGLMRSQTLAAGPALALAAGGVVFFLAQAADVAYNLTYPLYSALLTVGLMAAGMRLLRRDSSDGARATV